MENMAHYLKFLLIHESVHLFVAVLLSLLIYQWYGSFRLIFLLFAVTVLMDADHLFDSWMALGWNMNLNDLVTGKYWFMTDRLFVPLHSWELVLFVWLICWFRKRVDLGLTITLAMAGHILVDQFTYTMHPMAYSLFYRALHGFDALSCGSRSFIK